MARIDSLRNGNLSSTSAMSRRRSRNRKTEAVEKATKQASIVSTIATDATPVVDILTSNRQVNHFRRGDLTHVSDIIGKCNRMIGMHYKHDMPIHAEPLHPSLGLTFAMGEGIHDYITNRVITNAPDNVYARWACGCGKAEICTIFGTARGKPNAECCNTPYTKHRELVLPNEELGMVGSVDLSMMIDGALYITEIKSMAKSMFTDLSRPVPEHVIQVLFYWKFAKELGYQIHDKVSIIYAQKEFMFSGSPFKEFVLDAQEHLYKLDDYIEMARELKVARMGGDLPPRSCPSPDYKVATKCQMRTACFGLSD